MKIYFLFFILLIQYSFLSENYGGELQKSKGVSFEKHLILLKPTYLNGVVGQAFADVNNDGFLDVLTVAESSPNPLIWYENDGKQNFTPKPIETTTIFLKSLAPAIITKSGFVDVIVSDLGENGHILIYTNDGKQNFTKKYIDNNIPSVNQVSTADINNDGLLNIIAISYDSNFITWYDEWDKTRY